MPRPFTPKVLTANDLVEGDVIYLCEDGSWTRDLARAEILTDEADAQMRLIEASREADRLVGAYLADVTRGASGPEPVHFREAFRRRGPSNYPHGKQEARADV